MNHLKKFESGYSEINLFEWQDLLKGDFEDFSSYETKFLTSKINGKKIPNKTFIKRGIRVNRFIDWYSIVDIKNYGMSVFYSNEPEPDEVNWADRIFHSIKIDDGWFIVDIQSTVSNSWTNMFYKCDQWEGLLNLLRDLDILD
jgi:hypothetical protein